MEWIIQYVGSGLYLSGHQVRAAFDEIQEIDTTEFKHVLKTILQN